MEEKAEKEEGKRWNRSCSGLIAESRTGGQRQHCVRRLPSRPCVTSDPTVRRCQPPPSLPSPASPHCLHRHLHHQSRRRPPPASPCLLRSPSFRGILPSPVSGRDDETCRRTRCSHVPPGGDSRSCDAAVGLLAER